MKTAMVTPETYYINHPIFGPYFQVVYETAGDAGHESLDSEGRFGWGMPTDPATAQFVRNTVGKIILEIGSGTGHAVALPALEQGAKLVIATNIERESKHLESLARAAENAGRRDALKIQVLDEHWWDQELQDQPTTLSVLGRHRANPESVSLPEDETVDFMIARHSVQFGDPDKFLRLLDLAAVALRPGGTFTSINFTPYTGYMYLRHDQPTIASIVEGNKAFAAGNAPAPGGIVDDLRALIPIPNQATPIPFLYFDQPTIIGLLRCWVESRERRHLSTNLKLTASFYFSPPIIARFNKLSATPGLSEMLTERENHVFVLSKVSPA